MDISQAALELIWRLCAVLGALLIAAAVAIEPEASPWLLGAAGAFFAVSLGRDRAIRAMFLHIALGTIIGVAMAALLAWKFGTPRAALAFLIGLFGVDLFFWFGRQVRDGTLLESIGRALAAMRGK